MLFGFQVFSLMESKSPADFDQARLLFRRTGQPDAGFRDRTAGVPLDYTQSLTGDRFAAINEGHGVRDGGGEFASHERKVCASEHHRVDLIAALRLK